MTDSLEESKLIGDYTEDAVKNYFEACGFSMIRFGVERLFPLWLDEIKEVSEEIPSSLIPYSSNREYQQNFVRFLRTFPDFVAIQKNPTENGLRDIFPVEVKFRPNFAAISSYLSDNERNLPNM